MIQLMPDGLIWILDNERRADSLTPTYFCFYLVALEEIYYSLLHHEIAFVCSFMCSMLEYFTADFVVSAC